MLDAQVAQSNSSVINWIRQHPFLPWFYWYFCLSGLSWFPAPPGRSAGCPSNCPKSSALLPAGVPAWRPPLWSGALKGKAGIRNLFRRYLIWRVSIGWYLIALFGTAFFILGGIGLHILLGGEAPSLPLAGITPLDLGATFLIFIAFGLLGNLEDVAWRGVALPLLQSRHSALTASLIIGVLEGLTHLPYFFVPGDFRNQVGIWFMVFTVAIVIILTWMFNNTRGSLLIVVAVSRLPERLG